MNNNNNNNDNTYDNTYGGTAYQDPANQDPLSQNSESTLSLYYISIISKAKHSLISSIFKHVLSLLILYSTNSYSIFIIYHYRGQYLFKRATICHRFIVQLPRQMIPVMDFLSRLRVLYCTVL